MGDLFGALNRQGVGIADSPVTAENLGGLIDLIADNTISRRIARDVFETMVETGRDAAAIVAEQGLEQVTDTGKIEAIVDQVIAAGTRQVEQYRSGNEKVLGWFIGQVMQKTQGEANPQTVNEILRKKLAGS